MKLIINNRKMYLGSIKSFNISNCAVAEIVVGVAGYSVELECNLDPAIKGDDLLLVLWYKLGTASPVYT